MESTPILRRVGLVAVNLAAFAAAFLLVRGLIDRAAGWEPDGEVAVKLAHLEEHGEDYDVIFIGSSRTFRGVDPASFDARMAELGTDVRSFNLGIQGMFAYELESVLERVLALKLDSLEMVVVAPDVFQADLETEITASARVVAWHGVTETLAAVRRALDQPRTRPNKDVVVTVEVASADLELRRGTRRALVNEIENGFGSGRLVRLVGAHDTAAVLSVASSRLVDAPPERLEGIVADAAAVLRNGRWVDVVAEFSAARIEEESAVSEVAAVLEDIGEGLGGVGESVGSPFRASGNRLVLRIAPREAVAALLWAESAAVDAGGRVAVPVSAADGTWFSLVAPPDVRSGASELGERALWVYNHLNAFLLNSTNQGRLLEAVLGDGEPRGGDLDVLGPGGDGFVPYDVAEELSALGRGTEFRRRQFLDGEPIRVFTRSRLEPTTLEIEYGMRLSARIRAAGAIPVLAALPGDASSSWVGALEGEAATIDFNRFPVYSDLFDRSLWYDRGHMSSPGASLFSALLAEELQPLLGGDD